MKQKTETKQSNKSRFCIWFFYLGWILPVVISIAAQRILANFPVFVENIYTRGIFYFISWPFLRISSLFPFSLTEAVVVLLLPALIAFIIVAVIRLKKNKQNRRQRIVSVMAKIAWTAAVMLFVFMLMHGFNYARMPVADSFDLPVKERPAEDLTEMAIWLAQEASAIRENSMEDENGVFVLSKSLAETMKDVNTAYDNAQKDWPALKGHSIRPKGVLLSHYWSYTGITGVYNPWFVEANVNIDQSEYSIPDTVAHEVAHTRGFAREDEANFIAFLTGLYSDNDDYRYSVMINTWVRISNRLYSLDQEAYQKALEPLSEAMRRDLNANRLYWQQFEGPVKEVSNQANNLYLQANMQTDGVRSYGRMIDLALAWYELERN